MTDVDASLPLQKAILAKLAAAPTAAILNAISAGLSGRVYTRPSADAVKPYISLGPTQALPELAAEYEGQETTIQIDAWAAGPEPTEVKRIGRAIHTALHNAALTLVDSQRLVSIDVESTQYLTDPDGIGQHAALTFTALTEPSA